MKHIQSFKAEYGSIDLYLLAYPKAYLVKAKGIISSNLLSRYLNFIRKIDEEHTTLFDHVVDTSDVVFANPFNPIRLRALKELKHLNKYIVIVPNIFLRFLVKLTSWVNKPDAILDSITSYQAMTLKPEKCHKSEVNGLLNE